MQANLKYSEVMLRIKPLTKELDKLQESLSAGAERIEECTEELVTLDARKLDLQADLSSRTEEAAELKVLLPFFPFHCSSMHSGRLAPAHPQFSGQPASGHPVPKPFQSSMY